MKSKTALTTAATPRRGVRQKRELIAKIHDTQNILSGYKSLKTTLEKEKKKNAVALAHLSILEGLARDELLHLTLPNANALGDLEEAQKQTLRAYRTGDTTPVIDNLTLYGPELFLSGGEANAIFDAWVQLFRDGVQGDTQALQAYRKACGALAKGSQGALKKRDPYEQAQERKAQNRQIKRDTRMTEYLDKAWTEYQSKTQEMTKPADIKRVAQNIRVTLLSQNTPAINGARKSFDQKVNQDSRL